MKRKKHPRKKVIPIFNPGIQPTDSEVVSEAPIETSNSLADSSSVEEIIEEEITVPSIHSPLIDVPILL